MVPITDTVLLLSWTDTAQSSINITNLKVIVWKHFHVLRKTTFFVTRTYSARKDTCIHHFKIIIVFADVRKDQKAKNFPNNTGINIPVFISVFSEPPSIIVILYLPELHPKYLLDANIPCDIKKDFSWKAVFWRELHPAVAEKYSQKRRQMQNVLSWHYCRQIMTSCSCKTAFDKTLPDLWERHPRDRLSSRL